MEGLTQQNTVPNVKSHYTQLDVITKWVGWYVGVKGLRLWLALACGRAPSGGYVPGKGCIKLLGQH